MPIKQSAKKALRQTIKKNAHNIQLKKRVEFLLRKIDQNIKAKKLDEAKKFYHDLQQTVDKAAKMNVFHQNRANRIKKRILKTIK